MAEIKRKKGENFETFLRRFNKALKNSGKLTKARHSLHKKEEKNKRSVKDSKIHSLKIRKEKEYLRKIGKLEESGGRS